MIRLALDQEVLGRLFPAHLAVCSEGVVRRAGPALQRLAGDRLVGANFADVLAAAAPDLSAMAVSGETLRIGLRDPAIALTGTALAIEDGWLLALGIVPEATWPLAQPLQMADFAQSDPVVAAIMQSGIQAALLHESRAMALDLAAERQRVLDLLATISRSSAQMAHEFNNAASIIGLNCDRLLRGRMDDGELVRLVGIVRETSLRGQP